MESISSNADKDDVVVNFSDDEASASYALSLTALETNVADAIRVNLEPVDGYYTRDSLDFDGGRIKMGQIEPGVPDVTDA